MTAADAPKKLDLDRFRLVAGKSPTTYVFSRIGFDARGMRAVVMVSAAGGTLYELIRTVDGKWAVTQMRTLWIS